MANGSDEGEGREEQRPRPGGGRRRDVNSRLSLLASDEEGGSGGAGLRADGEPVETLASVRDENGGGRTGSDRREARQGANAGNGGGLYRGNDGDERHGEGRGAYVLPALGEIDSAELPNVPDGHRQEAGEAVADDPEVRVRGGTDLLADELDFASGLAIKRQIEILEMSIDDPDPEIRNATGRLVNQAAQTILTMKARADEGSFKRQALGKLPELLKIIHDEENRMKLIEGVVIEAV